MSLVSVILPVYNGQRYIGESIESVLNQTYTNFELIIVDDGSSDETLNIVRHYEKSDKRIKVITRENRGLCRSLNEAIHLSAGEYIARMDADDICFEERLEEQVKYLQHNKDVDIVGSMVEIIGDFDQNTNKKLNLAFGDDSIVHILNDWYCLAHPSLMMKSSVYRALNGYNIVIAEDLDLLLRAKKKGFTIKKLGNKLLRYRLHSESKTVEDNKGHAGIEEGVALKIEFATSEFSINTKNYAIWGTGTGGQITKRVMEHIHPHSNCICFIDPFKVGSMNNVPILHPDDVKVNELDYILVATEPGRESAQNFLENKQLRICYDFLCVI